MQLRLSFVLLGITAVALSRPIVIVPSQVTSTELSSATATSSLTSASASTMSAMSASTSTTTASASPTPLSASGLDARQIYEPFLEDRSLPGMNIYDAREIPSIAQVTARSADPPSLYFRDVPATRDLKDPSSQIEESYPHPRSPMEARAETLASDVTLSKRDLFAWMGQETGKFVNKIKEIGNNVKHGFNNPGASSGGNPAAGGGNYASGAQLQRRQDPSSPAPPISDVSQNGLVQAATSVAEAESRTKEGAKQLVHKVTDPFKKAGQGISNVAHGVGNVIKNFGSSVSNSYQEGAHGGSAPVVPA